MSEQKGFVQGVVFIIFFSAFLVSIPLDLQGTGTTPNTVIPVDPTLVSGFADSVSYDKSDFSGVTGLYYWYAMGSYSWEVDFASNSFYIGAKVLFFGIWLGALSYVNFISNDGTNYGTSITLDEIENDAVDGAVRYTLQFADNGNTAGAFVIYWNTSTYTDPYDAWIAEELYLVHGIGFDSDAGINIASLLLSILFLQLPDCPILINILIASPVWANIIFIFWYIIKETLPFV